MRFAALQSVRVSSPPSGRRGCPHRPSSAFLGVLPPIATSTRGVHSRRRPVPASFRPRRFARPRRFTPPPVLRVYFTPLPRPGFAPQGFLSLHSRTSSSLAVALVSLVPAPCCRLPSSASDVRPPSGPCSVHRSVAHRRGLAADSPVPLSSFSSLGFFSADDGVAFTTPPTMGFHALRRVTRPQPDVLLRDRPPV